MVKPQGNRIIGKRTRTIEQKTPSGIIIPASIDAEQYDRIEVLEVGKGNFNDKGERLPMETKVGDVVYVMKNTAYSIPKRLSGELKDNEDIVVFQENDIMFTD
mgnify:FL=1